MKTYAKKPSSENSTYGCGLDNSAPAKGSAVRKVADKRPEALQMHTLQLMANASQRARHQSAKQALADSAGVAGGAEQAGHLAGATNVAQLFPGVVESAYNADLQAGLRDDQGAYLQSNQIVQPLQIAASDFSGILQYVITEGGQLIIGQRSRSNRWAHPNLVGGVNPRVQAAGELKFSHSVLFALNSKSGHFQPPAGTLALASAVLSNTFNSTDALQVGDENFDLNTIRNPDDISSFNIFGKWHPDPALLDYLATANDASRPQLDRDELAAVLNDPVYRLYNADPPDLPDEAPDETGAFAQAQSGTDETAAEWVARLPDGKPVVLNEGDVDMFSS